MTKQTVCSKCFVVLETHKIGISLPWKQWADSSTSTSRVSSCRAFPCRFIFYALKWKNWYEKLMKVFVSAWTEVDRWWSSFLSFIVLMSVLQNNKIATITDETFCQGNSSHYIRTNMYEVRLDGNPIQLSSHPESFICLESLPIGWDNWEEKCLCRVGHKMKDVSKKSKTHLLLNTVMLHFIFSNLPYSLWPDIVSQ